MSEEVLEQQVEEQQDEAPKKLSKKERAAKKAADMANKRKRFKLRALGEQLREHAKKSGLQAFCILEGDTNLELAQVGHYSEYTIKQAVVYLATVHPVIFNDTIEKLNNLSEKAAELKEQEAQDNPPQGDPPAQDE